MTEAKTELQRNALAEARRKELDLYQRALDIKWLNSRMEDGRMGRTLALIKREDEMEKDYKERTDHAAIVNEKARIEIELGKEIEALRREETSKLQRRHFLRERDPSLRALVKKLEAGYVCRDQRQQILHNDYKRLQDKIEEDRANSTLRNALYNDLEQADKEAREDLARKAEYCKELQQQLVNRQQQRQCEYEEALIEKKMLDDIMRTIYDEDMKELKQKRSQTAQLRQEMIASQQARAAWRDKQRVVLLAQDRDIENQARAVANRSAAVVEERNRKQRIKEEINERIGAVLLADEAACKRRTDIIASLQEQEYLEKNVQDDIAERNKLERAKADTKQALTQQMEEKKNRVRLQKEMEAQFRVTTEENLKTNNKKEKRKEEYVLQKRRQYAEDLKNQIADNVVRRKRNKELEETCVRMVWDHDRNWRAEVDAERKAMIKEHVPHVMGYLQPGVLQQQDVPVLESVLGPVLDGQVVARTAIRPKCNQQCRIIREY